MELSEVGGLHTSRVVEASKISDKNQDFLRVHWGTVGLSWPAELVRLDSRVNGPQKPKFSKASYRIGVF